MKGAMRSYHFDEIPGQEGTFDPSLGIHSLGSITLWR